MNEDFKVLLSVEVNDADIKSLNSKIQSAVSTVHIEFDTTELNNFKRELDAINRTLVSIGTKTASLPVNSIGVRSNGTGGSKSAAKQIQEDYKQLVYYAREISKIKIQLKGLDSNTNSRQINELKKQLSSLIDEYRKYEEYTDGLLSESQLNNLARIQDKSVRNYKEAIKKSTDKSDNKVILEMEKQEAVEIESQYKELIALKKELSNTQLKLIGLDAEKDDKQIVELNNHLKEVGRTIFKLKSQTQGRFNTEQLSGLSDLDNENAFKLSEKIAKQTDTNNLKESKKDADELNVKYKEMKDLMKQITGIKIKLEGLDEETAQAKTLNNQLLELEKRFNHLEDKHMAKLSLNQIADLEKMYQDSQYAIQEKRAKLADNAAQQSAKNIANAYKGIDRVDLSNRIQTWMNRNSAAAKDYFKDLQRIQQELKECDDAKLGNLTQQFKRITSEASAQGKTGLTFFERFKSKMSELITYISVIDVIQGASRVVRDMAQNVLSVDTAMTELYRVTDLTKAQYDSLYKTMTADAKEYGTQLDTLINATASWTRLGFDANTAEKLAGVSAMYQHVTDLDEQTAVENLVTGYKAYQDQLLELTNNDSAKAVERVADIYDNLGNQLPVSAAQVGEGMTKWASVAEMAGASIEEASALLVGGGAVTQDFDRMGNALRTSALRIRGMKGALEELGEEVDDNVESVSKMQTHILNLTKGQVNIFKEDGESFRNIYDIYDDIVKVWDKLSETDQADLLETIAGKTRANDVKAVISNWAEVEKAASVAANSEGTAREEQEKYMNSLEGKLATLEATWQNLSNTFLSSDLLKNLLESATSLLDVVDGIVDKIGSLPTIITLISGGLSAFKNVGRCRMFHLIKYANSYMCSIR